MASRSGPRSAVQGDHAQRLNVQNLSVQFRPVALPSVPILKDLSFEIRPGESTGVLGESGCGKTTLARALLGILPPGVAVTGGQIHLGNEELTRATEKSLQRIRGNRISLIHQEAEGALHPLMRVREQVAEVFRAHRSWNRTKRLAEAQHILEEVFARQAERIGKAYPHELSGGQRQRVLIAQAIACAPQLIVADEPTASLDLTTQAEILELLTGLKRRLGMSLLLITHNPAILRALADRVMVLYAGRIVEEGSAQLVFSNPLHPYTKALLRLAERPAVVRHGKRQRLPTIPGDAKADSGGEEAGEGCACDYVTRCEQRLPGCHNAALDLAVVNHSRKVRCLLHGA